MDRKQKIRLVAGILLAAAIVGVLTALLREPRHDGKSLSAWLEILAASPDGFESPRPAEKAAGP